MHKKMLQRIFTITAVSCCLLFGGCGQSGVAQDSVSQPATETAISAEAATESSDKISAETTSEPSSESAEAPSGETADADTRTLTLSVVNMCGIEIGMVAVIDPVTGEQVNLDSLSDGESISMEADWPSSVTEFQWALYNTDGELCVEGKTDISAAKTSASLLLTGDGDLEKVEELFE